MDHNLCIFTGKISWLKEYRKDSQLWGTISCRIDISSFSYPYMDTIQKIDNPIIWLSIKTEYGKSNLDRSSQYILNFAEQKPFVCVSNAHITHFYKSHLDDDGKVIVGAPKILVNKIECSSSAVNLYENPISLINDCTISGEVKELSSDGFMVVCTKYRSKTGLKERLIPILCNPKSMAPGITIGTYVLVKGRLSCRTPPGGDRTFIFADSLLRI